MESLFFFFKAGDVMLAKAILWSVGMNEGVFALVTNGKNGEKGACSV